VVCCVLLCMLEAVECGGAKARVQMYGALEVCCRRVDEVCRRMEPWSSGGAL